MTALQAAAAAFKLGEQEKEEQSRQVDNGSLQGAKRKRESGELVELIRLKRIDKVILLSSASLSSDLSNGFSVFQVHCR